MRPKEEILAEASGWNSEPADLRAVLQNQSLLLEVLLDQRELLRSLHYHMTSTQRVAHPAPPLVTRGGY